MKLNKSKKGISLIVLVITIIVMIILAAAIILSLNGSGIIDKANEAKADSDRANAKHVVVLAKAEWDLMSESDQQKITGGFKAYAESKLVSAGYNAEDYQDIIDEVDEDLTPSTPSTAHNGIIPEGATYYLDATGPGQLIGEYESRFLTAGNEFPETVNTGDAYVYENYEYRYNFIYNINQYQLSNIGGWSVVSLDRSEIDLNKVLTEINGKPVIVD